MQKKVLLGMSGGVDSSVSAKLLLDKGYEVAGVTLHLHDARNALNQPVDTTCGSSKDIEDAKAVCDKLGIKHYVFDFREFFNEKVLNNFVSEYKSGDTPNPCIVCNRFIKFGKMLEKAEELGFDYVATGHYAKNEYDAESGRFLLRRPLDSNKDQTYVLYSLTQHQLSHILFPLGELTKPQVRAIAEENGFINAKKPDSQDICFVPDGDYASFIERRTGEKAVLGNYIDINGKPLGKHGGVIRYTIGQRKGLGIALGKPQFVINKNVADNTVTLGDEKYLFGNSAIITDCNFIPFDTLEKPLTVTAKARYRHTEQPAVISPLGGGRVLLTFSEPQRAMTPGQAAVFYDGETVIGGGTITDEKE